MILKEEQRDLFSVPHGYYFAHCRQISKIKL